MHWWRTYLLRKHSFCPNFCVAWRKIKVQTYKLLNNNFANYWIIVLQINILKISCVSYARFWFSDIYITDVGFGQSNIVPLSFYCLKHQLQRFLVPWQKFVNWKDFHTHIPRTESRPWCWNSQCPLMEMTDQTSRVLSNMSFFRLTQLQVRNSHLQKCFKRVE